MLKLRPFEPSDADTVVTWFADEVTFRRWCGTRYDHFPITGEDMLRHYETLRTPDNFFPMTMEEDGQIVGHMILRYNDEARTIAYFGYVVVDDRRRGTGCGAQMMRLAIRYAFDVMHAEKITLGVYENNAPAIRCYESVGFRDAGPEKMRIIHILGEDWPLREMELCR